MSIICLADQFHLVVDLSAFLRICKKLAKVTKDRYGQERIVSGSEFPFGALSQNLPKYKELF